MSTVCMISALEAPLAGTSPCSPSLSLLFHSYSSNACLWGKASESVAETDRDARGGGGGGGGADGKPGFGIDAG